MRIKFRIIPHIARSQDQRIVLANFFSLTTLQGLGYLIPIIILPYLLRIIGAEKFGLIAFAQALAQYFLIITDYGFSISATKKIALSENNSSASCKIFSSVMTIKIILSVLSFLVLLSLVHFVPRFKQDWQVYMISFGAVIGNTIFPVWLFQGKEKMKYITTINGITGILTAVCIFLIVRCPLDFIYVPLFSSLFSIIAGIWALCVAFKRFELKFIFPGLSSIKQEFKSGWSIFSSIVAINAYTTTRIFAVGMFTNNTITGYYSAADRIANFVQMFPQASFTQSVYPRLSQIFLLSKTRAKNIMFRIQAIATGGFLISLPILILFSPFIATIMCGAPYQEVIITLRLLLISVFFVGANALRVQYLLISGRTDLYSKLHITAAAIGLPLMLLLLYFFSYPGVAVTAIIVEAGVFLATTQLLKKA